MSLNRFFLLFLAISLGIFFGVTPYVIDQEKIENIPQLEFENFISYEIEGENLNVMMTGANAKRYDARFELEDFTLYREANNSVLSVSARDGLYKNKRMLLSDSVDYQGKDDLILQTEKALLDMKHNTLDIRVPFVLTQKGTIFTGSSLFFNQNNAKITAKDVRASFPIK